MGASLLPSIKRPARMAIFLGAGFSFSCAEPENSAEIRIKMAMAAAVASFGRMLASFAGRKSSTGIFGMLRTGRLREEKKRASRSQVRLALVLWPQPESIWLDGARCCGTRTAQRTAREVFHGGNAAASQAHDGMVALRHAGHRNFPTLLQHVQTDDDTGQ